MDQSAPKITETINKTQTSQVRFFGMRYTDLASVKAH